MNLDETLKQGLPSQQSSQDHWLQEPEDPRKRPERKWQWYDEADERKQQLMETSVARPYAGYAHLSNVPQSMKKMNRVLALVRGMYYDEALAQCKLFPHKAARYTEHVLDHAREDAERKGMNRDDLIIAMAYSTKGQYIKKRGYRGRGNGTTLITRRAHVEVELMELPRPEQQVFSKHTRPARVRDTVMEKWKNLEMRKSAKGQQQQQARLLA